MSERTVLEQRLRTLSEIHQIMDALKNAALAEVSRLRRFAPAQQRVARIVGRATADFLFHYPQPLEPPSTAREVWVLVGSERGFCGGYNDTVALAYQQQLAKQHSHPLLVVIGRRLLARLGEHITPVAVVEGPSVAEEVPAAIARLVDALEKLPVAPEMLLPLLTVFSHEIENHASQVRVKRALNAVHADAPARLELPRLYLQPLVMFRELTDHYLFAMLHELFYSALLAENEQRLQHLEGALHRVEHTKSELDLRRNALRQEEITEEIEVILLSAGMIEDEGGFIVNKSGV